MIVLMRCVAEAVMANGVKGLAGLVPGGGFLFEVATDTLRRLREEKRAAALRDEMLSAAAATFDEARAAAAGVTAEVGAGLPAEDRVALEMYLTQIPGAVRQSLKRADDPSGRSVPANFGPSDPADLARRLPAQAARLRPGQPLPGRAGWQVTELLGVGGFGEVWLARNPALAALKGAVKFGLDPQARERLLRHEGAIVSRVMEAGRHPNVVPLLDAHLEGDAPWLMYEYVGGGDLTGLMFGWQALPPAARVVRTADAFCTLAAAVGHFHCLSNPIVHRDLKPANILVAGAAKTPELKVADFGIGGVAADAALARETQRRGSTGVIGSQLWGSHTPLYASPQQQRGEAPDPRDDVHALGVIGYQMLTGKLDHAPGADFAKTLRRLGIPDPFIELIGDCAAHDPDNRPRDAADLADRLRALDGKPNVALVAETTRVACPVCAATLRMPVGKLSKSVTCPKCSHRFVPVQPPPPPPPPPLPAPPRTTAPPAGPTHRAVPATHPPAPHYPYPYPPAPHAYPPPPPAPHAYPPPPAPAAASPWESLPAESEPSKDKRTRDGRSRRPPPRSKWLVAVLLVTSVGISVVGVVVVVLIGQAVRPRELPYSYVSPSYNPDPVPTEKVSTLPGRKGAAGGLPGGTVFTGSVVMDVPKNHPVYLQVGQQVEVTLTGDGAANLDLLVFAPEAEFIQLVSGFGPTANETVRFTAPENGAYTVRVVNRDNRASSYRVEIREVSSSF